MGAAGGLLAASALRHTGPAAGGLAVAGAGLLARAVTNLPMKRVVGIGAGRRAVDVQKTMVIDAPVVRVFEVWSAYENFPRFMSNVREVRDLGDGRSHWTVSGPAGTAVGWDAVITERVPNQVLAWKTIPGAPVEHAGIVRFAPEGDGCRVTVRLSYNPPAGAVGHAVASLFGADPRRQIDDDLQRMKSFVETGEAPPDAAG